MSIELDKVKVAVGNGRGRSMIAALIARLTNDRLI
jgi:hypothetical protein